MTSADRRSDIDATTSIRELCAGSIYASANAGLYHRADASGKDSRRLLNVRARVMRHRLYETIVAVSRLRDATAGIDDTSCSAAAATALSGLTELAEAMHEVECQSADQA